MTAYEKRQQFRNLLSGETCVYTASVFDPVSALCADDIGFEVGLLGGSIASMGVLGAPDAYILTLSELVEQVRRISRVSKIPLFVDGDHGYGNALSVVRTVEELAQAGAAAVTIEDTLLPPAFGDTQERLTSVQEGVGRMCAAIEGRGDSGMVILARTSGPALTGVEDTIARCQAYAETGVDGIFLRGFRSREDFETIAKAIDLPLVVDPSLKGLRNLDLLASFGVRIALQGHQPFTAAAIAIYETMKALRAGASPEEVTHTDSAAIIRRISRQALFTDRAHRFLGHES